MVNFGPIQSLLGKSFAHAGQQEVIRHLQGEVITLANIVSDLKAKLEAHEVKSPSETHVPHLSGDPAKPEDEQKE